LDYVLIASGGVVVVVPHAKQKKETYRDCLWSCLSDSGSRREAQEDENVEAPVVQEASAEAVVQKADEFPDVGGGRLFRDRLFYCQCRPFREGSPKSTIARIPRVVETPLRNSTSEHEGKLSVVRVEVEHNRLDECRVDIGEMRSGEGDRGREIGKDKIKVHVNAWQIG
jgi:hypothetical protein